MLVVTIELRSAVDGHRERLGQMLIVNDGTGTAARGNYDAAVLRKRGRGISRQARVEDYPRKSYSVWRLVARALRGCFPEDENKPIVSVRTGR